MAFVKLDTRILESTLWIERECREVFITALLMALPREITEPMAQLEIKTLKETGFVVPPGWYGFVDAAWAGIIRRSLVGDEAGIIALDRLGSPDLHSRTADYEGRRLCRVNGGFVVLNFMKYRDRDTSGAERARRCRERKKTAAVTRDGNAVTRDTSLDRGQRSEERVQKDQELKDSVQQAARFDEFWQAYPVKRGKKAAATKWASRKLDAIADKIIQDVQNRSQSDSQWGRGYIPHPSTYLNQDRWEDELRSIEPTSRQLSGIRSMGDIFDGRKAISADNAGTSKNGLLEPALDTCP